MLKKLRSVSEMPHPPGVRDCVGEELGRGGMGVVYRGQDSDLQRDIAMKVLSIGDTDAERMRREARVLARIDHPGIVPIHDVRTLEAGRVFYTMRLVRGARLVFTADNRMRCRTCRVCSNASTSRFPLRTRRVLYIAM